MAAMALTTALPYLGHGRSSLLTSPRKGVSTRCCERTWLRKSSARVGPPSEFGLARRRDVFGSCVDSESEEGTVLKTVRDAGVGLLASLITLAAGVHCPCPALGLEAPLVASQAGRVSERASGCSWDAPSTSGCIVDEGLFSIARSHNEIASLGAVAENVTVPDECTEEIATSLVPKEEAVQEITNESVVEEAWQVVNENFLDARHNSWSADAWLKKKQEVLKNPIRSRMAAYGSIRNMLSSLNDPFTRFLSPDQGHVSMTVCPALEV